MHGGSTGAGGCSSNDLEVCKVADYVGLEPDGGKWISEKVRTIYLELDWMVVFW